MRVRVAVSEHDEASDLIARHCRKHALEFVRPTGLINTDLGAEHALPFDDPASRPALPTPALGLIRTPIRRAFGTSSCTSCRRLATTSPDQTDAGDVAAGARHRHREAHVDRVVDALRHHGHGVGRILGNQRRRGNAATSTSGSSRNNSLASSGRRSSLPSAHRTSMTTFWPSTYPSSRSPCRNGSTTACCMTRSEASRQGIRCEPCDPRPEPA